MRTAFLLALLGISGVLSPARADILAIRQDLVVPNSEDRVEVTTFLAETAEDRQKIVDRLKKSLETDLSTNPSLVTGFESISPETKRAPSSDSAGEEAIREVAGDRKVIRRTLPSEVRKALRIRYPEWFVRKSPVVFSVSRAVVNGAVATWGLHVAQGLPFPVAFAAGALTGGMSGGLQYFNNDVRNYLNRSVLEKLAHGRLLRSVKNGTVREGLKYAESAFRWYFLEVGFVTTVQIALTAMGHPPEGTFAHVVGTNLVTALATLKGQGLWDIAVSRATLRDLKNAGTEVARRAIRFRADFITLGLSALAVGGMVAKISNLSLGDTIFWGMAATGGAYLLKVVYDEWRCRRFLRAGVKPDSLGAPPAGSASLSSDDGDSS